MSSNLSESLSSTQRRAVLPTLLDAQIEGGDSSNPQGSEGEHDTLYIAFDAPGELGAQKAIGAASSSENLSELVASQALELAANRAEIARHQREHEDLQRGLRLRDGWLQELRTELKVLQEERQKLLTDLLEARTNLEQLADHIGEQDAQIKALEADAVERMGKTIFPSERVRPITPAPTDELKLDRPASLEPLEDTAGPIVLNRKVMTVGRTRDNHVFVPSQLASRDHARLLVSEEGVIVFDVGSANGSFVNDHQIRRQTLRDGDIVRFGDRAFRFRV